MNQKLNKIITAIKGGKSAKIILIVLTTALLAFNIFQAVRPRKELDTAGVARVGFINMVRIQMDAKVMKDLNNQNQKFIQDLEKSVEKKRKEFTRTEDTLKKQQATLSSEAFAKKVNDFRNDVMAYDKQTSDKLQAVKTAYNEALVEIQKDYLNDIINETAAYYEYDIVVDANNSKLLNPDFDITDKVIETLNDKISTKKMENFD
ncbi:MAG: OmpH family outer membrane protein [Rickettsiales bacterium]|jgi:Skp family chaperone for outer membrane proteins|nr:OmpH family outer membrane protein [Rickettsiales bacterium]